MEIFQKLKVIWCRLRIHIQGHKGIWIVAGILILGIGLELGLNLWLRSALRREFIAPGSGAYRLDARISWLNLMDLASGKVKWIRIKAKDCLVSELVYQSLEIDNQGLDVDLPRLLTKRELVIENIATTRVRGVIGERGLTDYLRLKYSQYQPEVRMLPGQIQVFGDVNLFGAATRVQVAGGLKASGPKTLRFFPEQVQIATRNVPRELLEFISTQLPLAFSLMENWPLQILKFTLGDQAMTIELMEIPDYPSTL